MHEKAGYLRLLIAFQPNTLMPTWRVSNSIASSSNCWRELLIHLPVPEMPNLRWAWLDAISSTEVLESFSFQVSLCRRPCDVNEMERIV